MEKAPERAGAGSLAAAARRLGQRLLIIFENRLQLLLAEVQTERERFLRALWLVVVTAVFGLLAGITLTGLIVVALWNYSPFLALAGLTLAYAAAAGYCFAQLRLMQRDWPVLPATLEEFRKDCECLEKPKS